MEGVRAFIELILCLLAAYFAILAVAHVIGTIMGILAEFPMVFVGLFAIVLVVAMLG